MSRSTDPLDMAMVQAQAVRQMARPLEEAKTEDERIHAQMDAYIAGVGKSQYQAAQMGAYLALISVAHDIRRIANHLAGPGSSREPADYPQG